MAEPKTRPHDGDVTEFLDGIENETKRADAFELVEMMRRITGDEPQMWGPSIVGFGSRHYVYDSGREGDWFIVGFSPRKQSLTLYVMDGFTEYRELLDSLGKHSTGKACLYVKKLDDVDRGVLETIIERSVATVSGAED